jgi:hypothetical protein
MLDVVWNCGTHMIPRRGPTVASAVGARDQDSRAAPRTPAKNAFTSPLPSTIEATDQRGSCGRLAARWLLILQPFAINDSISTACHRRRLPSLIPQGICPASACLRTVRQEQPRSRPTSFVSISRRAWECGGLWGVEDVTMMHRLPDCRYPASRRPGR